jgi:hypothetical protein
VEEARRQTELREKRLQGAAETESRIRLARVPPMGGGVHK